LIVGGGYVGVYTALGLRRLLRSGEAKVTLVSPESFMLYQPFLPEAASGTLEPRHVVIPLRRSLRGILLITGSVTAIDHRRRRATIHPSEGQPYSLPYDILVLGMGSVSRVLDVPGLAGRAVGFKTVAEAIFLRNQVLSRLDAAESTRDGDVRRRALTFLFVGGGYAGVEALGELEDLARDACRYYRTVGRADMRWIMVEASTSILPEIGGELAAWGLRQLRNRDIEVHLGTRLVSAEEGRMALSNGETFEAETLVWTTGVRAHPLIAAQGFPVDDRGSLITDPFLRVTGVDDVWAGGDCAAVPDLARGGICPPTAQHALRQARAIARNITGSIRGAQPQPFRYRQLGGLVSLGRYKGVAMVLGIRLKGFPAWFLHRTYHLSRIPTLNRKVRVTFDWTVALFFKRDVVQLGSLQRPHEAFEEAMRRSRGAQAGPTSGDLKRT